MSFLCRVAVCSRSFSNNQVLRAELLERYPHATFNDSGRQLDGDSLVEFLKGQEKAIVALEKIDAALLARLPGLKVISKYGVGLDMIDLVAMREYGKRLGWTGGVNRRSVSELVVAFAIVTLRKVWEANRELQAGSWRQHIGNTLSGRTVGIVGCGHVGKDLVLLLEAFGCTILANDIRDDTGFYRKHRVHKTELNDLLSRADIVTLHVPLDDSTRGMLDATRLALLKRSAILINTARGGLVDEHTLKEMLKDGRLAAAAFDVFTDEPPSDAELLSLPNFVATPHIGGSAHEAILAMGRAAINGLTNNELPSGKV